MLLLTVYPDLKRGIAQASIRFHILWMKGRSTTSFSCEKYSCASYTFFLRVSFAAK